MADTSEPALQKKKKKKKEILREIQCVICCVINSICFMYCVEKFSLLHMEGKIISTDTRTPESIRDIWML